HRDEWAVLRVGSGAQEQGHRGFRSHMSTTSLLISFVSFASFLVFQPSVRAQSPDWTAIGAEATRLLQDYVRIDTSNPPGDTRKAADFLAGVLEREGIAVVRYESAPGKAIVLARLKATTAAP